MITALTLALTMSAAEAPPPSPPGVWQGHIRLRYEHVAQDNLPRNANGLTARLRLGWQAPVNPSLEFLIEGEAIAALVRNYNDTISGPADRPVIADPEAVELNRLQLRWNAQPSLSVTLGRQRIIAGDARHIGNVGFRQNEQTYDAVRVQFAPQEGVKADYTYIDNVHRVFGPRSPAGRLRSDSHVVQASTETPLGHFTAYGHWFDFANAPALSSRTLGGRLDGERTLTGGWAAQYTLEAADQAPRGQNLAEFSHQYYRASLAVARPGMSYQVRYERLAGNGVTSFQTPLATLHAFQGWADVFLATPPEGLEDYSVHGRWTLSAPGDRRAQLGLSAHEFRGGNGAGQLGRELDVSVRLGLGQGWDVELKSAFFDGRGARFADRQKIWMTLERAF